MATHALTQPAPVIQHQPALDRSIRLVQADPITTKNDESKILYGWQTEDKSELPVSVSMPSVNINLALSGSREQDGQWEISENGANFALNSAIPSVFGGNTVLFGHDRPQLFRNIHKLEAGHEVTVIVGGTKYVYTVFSSETVSPTDVRVFNQTTASTLTLITCDGWTSAERYIVHATFSRIEI